MMTTHTHENGVTHSHGEAVAPSIPSRAVVLDVDEECGALILASSRSHHGVEVEIHSTSDPSARQHVWVLPREGRGGATIFAAVFPRLLADTYTVLDVDGTPFTTIEVLPNRATYASWHECAETAARS